MECAPPSTLPNAEAVQDKLYFYGDRIRYKCLPGYQQYGDLSIRCEAEARWTGIRGRCISKNILPINFFYVTDKIDCIVLEVSCGRPKLSEKVTIQGTSYLYQDTIEITCGKESSPSAKSVHYITCQANGLWSQLPHCN